jgi:hypothetical protein
VQPGLLHRKSKKLNYSALGLKGDGEEAVRLRVQDDIE